MAKKKTEKQELDPPAWQSPVYMKALAKVKELEQIDREGKTPTAFNSHKHVYVLKEGAQSGREFAICVPEHRGDACGRVKTWGDFPKGYSEEDMRLTGHFFDGVNQAAGTTDLQWIRMPRYEEEDYD